MTAATVAGVYALHRWLATGRARWIAISAALVALAGLLKLTALHVLLPAAFWFWIAGRDRLGHRAAGGLLYLAAVLLPVAAWYAYSRQLDRESGIVFFGNSDFVGGRWVSGPLLVSLDYWRTIVGHYFVGRYLAYLGLPVFLIGLVLPRRRPAEWAIDLWLAAYLLTSLVIVRGTYIHEYYQLPLAVPVAITAGRAAAWFVRPAAWRRWLPAFITICLAGFFVLSATRYAYTYLASERVETNRLYQFAQEVRARTAPDDRIVSVDGMFILYHADRRGWSIDRDRVTDAYLRDKIDRGASYLVGQAVEPPAGPAQDVIDRYLAGYPIVYQDDRSFIVRLDSPGR